MRVESTGMGVVDISSVPRLADDNLVCNGVAMDLEGPSQGEISMSTMNY